MKQGFYEDTYCRKIQVDSTSQAHEFSQDQTSYCNLESHMMISYSFPFVLAFLQRQVLHRQFFLTRSFLHLVLIILTPQYRFTLHQQA